MKDLKSNLWVPKTGWTALALQTPNGQIKSLDSLRGILEVRLSNLILESEGPEDEVQLLLESLEASGLVDPHLSKKKLVARDRQELADLLERPELWTRIMQMLGALEFPLMPNATEDDATAYEEMSLEEWAQQVTQGL